MSKESCSRWSATGLGIRLEIWIWKRGGRGEDLQVVHPLFWLEWPLSSQEFLPFGVLHTFLMAILIYILVNTKCSFPCSLACLPSFSFDNSHSHRCYILSPTCLLLITPVDVCCCKAFCIHLLDTCIYSDPLPGSSSGIPFSLLSSLYSSSCC